MGRFVVGLVIGIMLIPLCAIMYFKFGRVPVAVNDPPFPDEKLVTSVPLECAHRPRMVKNPPIEPNEENFVAGRACLRRQLRGVPWFPQPAFEGRDSRVPGRAAAVGEARHGERGGRKRRSARRDLLESGQRHSPDRDARYKELLTEAQMWQVSLLLANADKPLPPGGGGNFKRRNFDGHAGAEPRAGGQGVNGHGGRNAAGTGMRAKKEESGHEADGVAAQGAEISADEHGCVQPGQQGLAAQAGTETGSVNGGLAWRYSWWSSGRPPEKYLAR